MVSGERGTWQVYDKACLPNWGTFIDDGCKSKGFRQYSAPLNLNNLKGVPDRSKWGDFCKVFPADIKGVGFNTQHFYQPDR